MGSEILKRGVRRSQGGVFVKRWYLVAVILALLLVMASGGCYAGFEGADEAEIDRLEAELAQLREAKEINFGNGLRVFDIEKGWYEVRGKIENISSEPMRKVVILVAFYNQDGQLDQDWGSVGQDKISHLYPAEVLEWTVHFGNWTDQELGLFDIYAIGNR